QGLGQGQAGNGNSFDGAADSSDCNGSPGLAGLGASTAGAAEGEAAAADGVRGCPVVSPCSDANNNSSSCGGGGGSSHNTNGVSSSYGNGGSSSGCKAVVDGGLLAPPPHPHAASSAPPPGDAAAAGWPMGRGFCVPVLVTGDFNTMPDSKTCAAFRRHPLGLMSLWEQPPLEPSLAASCSGSDMDLPPLPSRPPQQPHQEHPQQQQQAQPQQQQQAQQQQPQQQQLSSQPQQPQSSAPLSHGEADTPPLQAPPAAQHPQHPQSASLASPSPTSPPPPAAAAAPPSCRGEFSTWKFRPKGESKRISDYIWFSGCGLLRPLQRWRMLTEEEIGPGALPSSSYASDHVSLCCEFEWDGEADPLEGAPACAAGGWGEQVEE
ncbi:hypothetical protein Agub_g5888, partial [Astrephomene gubernaculifera]